MAHRIEQGEGCDPTCHPRVPREHKSSGPRKQAGGHRTCDSTNTQGVRLSVSLYTSRMDASGRSTKEDPRDARMNSDMPARTKSSLKIWGAPHAKGVTHT